MEHMRHPEEAQMREPVETGYTREELGALLKKLEVHGFTVPDTEEAMQDLQKPGDTLVDPDKVWTITVKADGTLDYSF